MKFNIKSMGISTIITMWFIAIVTVWAEQSAPFKDSLAAFAGHHWVAKGILSLVLFIVLYFVFSRLKEPKDIQKQTYLVIASAILAGLVIMGFFTWHFLGG